MELEEFLNDWHSDNPRMLVHTSGSTGEPKPLWVEKRRMEASARITCRFLGLQRGDTALLCLPMDYIAGKMMAVRAEVWGLRLVCVKPNGRPLQELESPPDFAAMVPLQVYNSLQTADERATLRAIKHLIIGGGAIDDALVKELRTFPNAVYSTYGMTETLSHIALRRLSGDDVSEWYTPFEGVSVSLTADGCLAIDAPAVCPTPLTTNDLAELHDGRFRIVGRKDNTVCSGGIKIQIEKAEQLLMPHLDVPFALTKRPDQRLGEALILVAEPTDEVRLRDICRQALPRLWQPQAIVFVEKIPLTTSGKRARKQLELIAAQS